MSTLHEIHIDLNFINNLLDSLMHCKNTLLQNFLSTLVKVQTLSNKISHQSYLLKLQSKAIKQQ